MNVGCVHYTEPERFDIFLDYASYVVHIGRFVKLASWLKIACIDLDSTIRGIFNCFSKISNILIKRLVILSALLGIKVIFDRKSVIDSVELP